MPLKQSSASAGLKKISSEAKVIQSRSGHTSPEDIAQKLQSVAQNTPDSDGVHTPLSEETALRLLHTLEDVKVHFDPTLASTNRGMDINRGILEQLKKIQENMIDEQDTSIKRTSKDQAPVIIMQDGGDPIGNMDYSTGGLFGSLMSGLAGLFASGLGGLAALAGLKKLYNKVKDKVKKPKDPKQRTVKGDPKDDNRTKRDKNKSKNNNNKSQNQKASDPKKSPGTEKTKTPDKSAKNEANGKAEEKSAKNQLKDRKLKNQKALEKASSKAGKVTGNLAKAAGKATLRLLGPVMVCLDLFEYPELKENAHLILGFPPELCTEKRRSDFATFVTAKSMIGNLLTMGAWSLIKTALEAASDYDSLEVDLEQYKDKFTTQDYNPEMDMPDEVLGSSVDNKIAYVNYILRPLLYNFITDQKRRELVDQVLARYIRVLTVGENTVWQEEYTDRMLDTGDASLNFRTEMLRPHDGERLLEKVDEGFWSNLGNMFTDDAKYILNQDLAKQKLSKQDYLEMMKDPWYAEHLTEESWDFVQKQAESAEDGPGLMNQRHSKSNDAFEAEIAKKQAELDEVTKTDPDSERAQELRASIETMRQVQNTQTGGGGWSLPSVDSQNAGLNIGDSNYNLAELNSNGAKGGASPGSGDAAKAAAYATQNAEPGSVKRCARYVRIALEKAGYKFESQEAAYMYATRGILTGMGFQEIDVNAPKAPGDICVIGAGGSHKYGHISIFNGKNWVSDFVQRNMIPYRSLAPGQFVKVYRDGGDGANNEEQPATEGEVALDENGNPISMEEAPAASADSGEINSSEMPSEATSAEPSPVSEANIAETATESPAGETPSDVSAEVSTAPKDTQTTQDAMSMLAENQAQIDQQVMQMSQNINNTNESISHQSVSIEDAKDESNKGLDLFMMN